MSFRSGKSARRDGVIAGCLIPIALAGCGRDAEHPAVAAAKAASTPSTASYFDPYALQRVQGTADAGKHTGMDVPTVLIPAEPMPVGYLSPPPREMLSGTTGRLVLGVGGADRDKNRTSTAN